MSNNSNLKTNHYYVRFQSLEPRTEIWGQSILIIINYLPIPVNIIVLVKTYTVSHTVISTHCNIYCHVYSVCPVLSLCVCGICTCSRISDTGRSTWPAGKDPTVIPLGLRVNLYLNTQAFSSFVLKILSSSVESKGIVARKHVFFLKKHCTNSLY